MSTLTVSNLQGSTATANLVNMPSGHAMYYGGAIIQIQQTVKTDTFSAAPNGTWTDITGLSVSITPKKTSSRILIMVTVNGAGSGTTPKVRLLRGSTVIAAGDTSGSKQSGIMGSFLMKDTNQTDTYTSHFLDSPASTSSTTYKMQLNNDNAQTVFINRSVSDQDNATGGRYISVITAMEIAVV